jgi:long-chain acyl-CoA synthetase
MTLTTMLADMARRYPRRAAVWSHGGSLSYQQLVGEAQKFAAVLAGMGVRSGDRVIIMLPNWVQCVVAFYGTLWRGAVAVLAPPDSGSELLHNYLVDSACKVAVVPSPLPEPLYEFLREDGPENILLTSGREYTRSLRGWLKAAAGLVPPPLKGQRLFRWRPLMREAREGFPFEPLDPSAPAIIEYTGGTTGQPKGAVLSHRALVANTVQLRAWDQEMTVGKERILGAVPFHHAYGITACLNLSVALAGTLLLPDATSPTDILETIQRFQPTLFPGIPALYALLLQQPKLRSYGLSSIRACLSGSSPLPVELQEGFEKVTKGHLLEGYGLTEAGPVTHLCPFGMPRRTGSMGLPLPSTEARIVDEEGQDLPHGQIGEICVRGPQLMDGYWKNPGATARALRDGWLFTGDMGLRDADGFFFVVNRKQDVLYREGTPVYPRDVEEILHEHPAIVDAAIVGNPRPPVEGRWDCAELVAFVALRQDASPEQILQFCRRRLPPEMQPTRVEILPALPRTPLGKVKRRELWERL